MLAHFDFLVDKIKRNIDIMMISETKLHRTFLNRQIFTDGPYGPIRLEENVY